jgi:hypothetical protein
VQSDLSETETQDGPGGGQREVHMHSIIIIDSSHRHFLDLVSCSLHVIYEAL